MNININLKELDFNSPNIEPKKIGSYSLDIDRTFENSEKNKKIFIEPEDRTQVNFDLNKGYVEGNYKIVGKENDLHILNWLEVNMDKLKDEDIERKLNTDFVCRRGLLTNIMLSPYDKKGWSVAVIRCHGTYYINEIFPEGRRDMTKLLPEEFQKCYWGWKFEQYLTADQDGNVNTDKLVTNNDSFYAVFKTQFKDHSLVYSGEIDAVDNEANYIELKTDWKEKDITFERYKMKKWWAQSHLADVKKIECGIVDEKTGVVGCLKSLQMEKLNTTSDTSVFNRNRCRNFLDKFLSLIKSKINTDDPKSVHTLKWTPSEKRIEYSLPLTDSEYSFLPQGYIEGLARFQTN